MLKKNAYDDDNRNVINQNLEIFNKHYQHWLEKLNETDIDSNYQILETKTGDLTLAYKKEAKEILLHSKYDPKKEALKLIDRSIENEPEVIVIGGFGLGYLVEGALGHFHNCHVVIWDFDWSVLKLALNQRDLSHIFANPRAHFVFSDNPQSLIDLLKEFKTSNIAHIIHRPSQQIYPEQYAELNTALVNFQNTKEINVATLNRFQKLWTKNILNNLLAFVKYKGIKWLFNQFTDIPCVIVAAGPSLAKNIHLLKEIKGKAIIIAVDTVLQILQNHEIEADFAIAVDPQDINKKYFEHLKTTKTILICEPSISPKIVNLYPGPKMMLGSVFQLVKWLEDLTYEKGEIDIGGSVATAAYGMAVKMGCDPIIFIGMDLAYSNNQTHIKGAYFEENWFYSWNRFKNIHYLSWDFLKKHHLFDIKGYQETTVKSDRKFHMFQKWFESQFNKTDKTIIDATEGGALKENCLSIPFREAIDHYIQDSHFQMDHLVFYEQDYDLLLKKLVIELEKVVSSFRFLEKEVRKGKRLAEELYGIVSKVLKNNKPYPRRVNEIHQQLDKLDQLITSNNTINALISITIQNLIHAIDNNSDEHLTEPEKENKELKVARQSFLLYEGILDSIYFNVNQFSKTHNKVQNYLGG